MASIYRSPSGWRAQVRVTGKPSTSKVFPTKADAQRWAREQEGLLHKTSSRTPFATFAQILAAYRANSRPGGSTKQSCLNQLERYWASWRMTEVHTGSVTDYVNKRARDGLAPCSLLQELTYFATVLRHGGVLMGCDEALIAREKVSSTITTLRHLGIVAESPERKRRPTEDELLALARHFATRPRSSVPMMDIVLWAICTACRLSEITGRKGAKREDLDPKNRTIWIRNRKHPRLPEGRDDLIPLLVGPVTFAGNAVDPLEIVERQKTRFCESGPIFPYAPSTIEAAFIQACKDLEIEDLRFHDLRHDGISRLFEADYDIPQVAAVSGHRSWKNLKRYTHLRPSSIHKGPTLVGVV